MEEFICPDRSAAPSIALKRKLARCWLSESHHIGPQIAIQIPSSFLGLFTRFIWLVTCFQDSDLDAGFALQISGK